MEASDTIYALASAPGRSGVAVLRLSGPDARRVALGLGARLDTPRLMALSTLRDPTDSRVLDQALSVWFPGPASFTGEDVVELHLHGGRAILNAVFEALSQFPDTRPADPGEFSRRAFLNDKMDLVEAEGLADLIDAGTERQRQQALRQMQGGLSAELDAIRDALVEHMALLEAWIDFPDEELPDDVLPDVQTGLQTLRQTMEALLSRSGPAERLRDGLSIAIVGPPNAGKSSLLNLLSKRDVAIVSDTAGTTRDVLEVHLDLNGYPITLFDTAGLRETEDSIEMEGIKRALSRAKTADLTILVVDGTTDEWPNTVPQIEPDNLIRVFNKVDKQSDHKPTAPHDWIGLSVTTQQGLPTLLDRLALEADARMNAGEAAGLTQHRHQIAVRDALEAIRRTEAGLTGVIGGTHPIELVSEDLRAAAHAIGRITGRVDVDQLLDVIFSRFCLGK